MPNTATRDLRLLIADRDPAQRDLIARQLAGSNATVVAVGDAIGTWKALGSRSFDLAVVDLDIPELDAPALIQFVRGNPRTRQLPVIIVTAEPASSLIDPAIDAGATSSILRPIHSGYLELQVSLLLRMVEAARAERTAAQRTIAVHRATEAVLGNLAGEAAIGTAWLDEEIEALRRLPMPQEVASPVLHRINRISRECRALQDHAARAATAISFLGERVVADDRKESLRAIVDNAVAALADGVTEGEAPITVKLPAEEVRIACDGDGIELAVTQLLRNAVLHSKAGSGIEVGAQLFPDGLLCIEVTDHGRGMHPDVLARAFAPLRSRLDGSRAGPFMGLGLLSAKAIAEAHGGTLELRSMPDQGTTALLVLPPERVVVEVAADGDDAV